MTKTSKVGNRPRLRIAGEPKPRARARLVAGSVTMATSSLFDSRVKKLIVGWVPCELWRADTNRQDRPSQGVLEAKVAEQAPPTSSFLDAAIADRACSYPTLMRRDARAPSTVPYSVLCVARQSM